MAAPVRPPITEHVAGQTSNGPFSWPGRASNEVYLLQWCAPDLLHPSACELSLTTDWRRTQEVGIGDRNMDKFCEACTVLLQVIADADPDQFPKHGSAFPPAGKNASDVARHAAGSYSRKRLSGKLSFGKHRLAVSHTGNEQCHSVRVISLFPVA